MQKMTFSNINIKEAGKIMKAMWLYQLQNSNVLRNPLIPMLQGAPGVGKTSMARQVCQEVAIEMDEEVLFINNTPADKEPTEFAGFFMPNHEYRVVERWAPNWYPKDPNALAFLLLDEVPNCVPSQMNNLPRLVQEREFDGNRLGDRVFIALAGNRITDKANANQLPSHLRDRLTYLNVEADPVITDEHFANIGVDPDIRYYLKARPGNLAKFDPTMPINASPRSWEKADSIIKMYKAGLLEHSLFELCMDGTVSPEISADFKAYMRVRNDLPSWDRIIKDPEKVSLKSTAQNSDVFLLWAVIGLVAQNTDHTTVEPVSRLMERLRKEGKSEHAFLLLRDLEKKSKEARKPFMDHPSMVKWKMDYYKEISSS